MRELHSMITEGGSDASVFIDIGGIDCLVKMMQTAISSTNLYVYSMKMGCYACLLCFFLLQKLFGQSHALTLLILTWRFKRQHIRFRWDLLVKRYWKRSWHFLQKCPVWRPKVHEVFIGCWFALRFDNYTFNRCCNRQPITPCAKWVSNQPTRGCDAQTAIVLFRAPGFAILVFHLFWQSPSSW